MLEKRIIAPSEIFGEDSPLLLSAIVEQTADAVLVTNREGVIRYVNSSFESLTGFSREEAIGKTPSILKSGQQDPAFYADLWNTVLSGRPFQGVLINRKKNGEFYYSRKTITPLRSKGEITHFVSTDKDITCAKLAEAELKRRADELKRSNDDLEQFANFIAHDLQEPARMVVSYLELLKGRLRTMDKESDEYFHFALDGGRRMQRMIAHVLTYSRAGKEMNSREVNCEEVLRLARENLTVQIWDSRADISHGPLPTILGDETLLCQLFQNLIGNAIKYQKRHSPIIHIEATLKEGEWLFSFRDNGIGISKEHTRRIFCLFQRLHRKSEIPGNGIGLALCERIVVRHGGRIWVDSEPDQGSTFYFTLPAKG